jgi:pyrimidine nucleoside transport protein
MISSLSLFFRPDATVLEAAATGATTAMPLVLGIIANLIAFVSFIAFINGVLAYFGSLVGFDDISLEMLFGKIFTPLAWVLGVEWAECEFVGQLIGLKSIVNEFVAFQKLGEFKRLKVISDRSAAIATYAICGFANPSSLGIMIAALSAMCPEKKTVITQTAVSGLICGSLVCFMTASIAGLLMTDEQISGISAVTLLSNNTFI